MSFKTRPLGVTILAILGLINVAVYIGMLVLTVALPDVLRSLLERLSPQGAGPKALLNLGPVLGIYFAVMAVIAGLFAYGMWTLRNWARWIVIIIAVISLAGVVVEVAAVASDLSLSTVGLSLVRTGLSVLVLWYLFRPSVREAFRKHTIQKG